MSIDLIGKQVVLKPQIMALPEVQLREFYQGALTAYETHRTAPGDAIYALLDPDIAAKVGVDIVLRAELLGLLSIETE
jgi:hypothetical protein